jgi:hypothetical protein
LSIIFSPFYPGTTRPGTTVATLAVARRLGMANPLIAALRQHRTLKQSVLSTAQNLASRASIYGVTPPTAYSFLAQAGHCSPRTAIRHIHILEAAKILEPIRQKRMVRRKDLPPTDRGYTDDPRRAHERVIRNEINHYRFVLKWDKSSARSHSSSCPYDTVAQKLPPPEREKSTSLREELENAKKVLRDCTPGSLFWQWTQEDIVRLEGLLGRGAASETKPAAVAEVGA